MMKTRLKYIHAVLALGLAASCTNELAEESEPVFEGKSYVFSADLGAGTRTVLDGRRTLWLGDGEGNEYITVMEPGAVNRYVARGISEPTAKADFEMVENSGPGLLGKAAFAVYPAGDWTCFDEDGRRGVNVVFASEQTAHENSYDPAGPVSVAYNPDVESDRSFTFRNVSALLKFRILEYSDPIHSVRISSVAGEPVSGAMTVLDAGDNWTVEAAEEGVEDWVELSAAEGGTLEAGMTYYLAVAPATFEKGLTVVFNGDSGKTFDISGNITLERNRIYDLGYIPGDNSTPEGKQWMYVARKEYAYDQQTWRVIEDQYVDVHAIFDFGATVKGSIDFAENFNESMTSPYTGEFMADIVSEPGFNQWVSNHAYFSEKYKVTPYDATSGEITWVDTSYNSMFGEKNTIYYRILYSDFTGDSMRLYSPGLFKDENGGYLQVTNAKGDAITDEYGWPYYYCGVGIGDDGFPVKCELVTKLIPITYLKN